MVLYIIGMPGTGKTHFGRILARSLRLQFYDLDEWLEKSEGKLIRHIINENGEEYFRLKEKEALLHLAKGNNSIIACGGGTPVFHNAIDHMKMSGIVIWINTDLKIIAKRISQNQTRRPYFAGLNNNEIQDKLRELFEKRKKIYAKADIILEINGPYNSSLNTVIQKVIKISQRKNK